MNDLYTPKAKELRERIHELNVAKVKLYDEYALKKSGIDNELQKLQIELNLLLAKELTTV